MASLAGAILLLCGCDAYRNLVDPCYPDRYTYQARQETNAAFAPQVNNGRVLDQTVWNHHFEVATDKLNAAGLDKLSYLARRRPMPDYVVYLQTAQDVPYDASAPDKFAAQRSELDNRRIKAIETYLNATTAGRGVAFTVVVHDPSDVSLPATPLGGDGRTLGSVQKMYLSFQGTLAAPGGGGGAAGGAPAGGSSAGTAGPAR
jgi:hypothetical protein